MTDNTPNLLSDQQMADYRQKGHLTTNRIFDSQTIDTAIRESEDWQRAFLADIDQAEETYFLEQEVAEPTLRKLDQPVYERAHFRRMASHPVLVGCVEQLIGIGVSVYFSQIFCKAPNGSAAKPVHQDNFYFDPDNKDGLITAWVALDDATVDNGCLFFAEGTHLGPVYPHVAAADQPFNLQMPPDIAQQYPMSPAPVDSGSVSFHHGSIFHQSSANQSPNWRRAVAFHYLHHQARCVAPNLTYDPSKIVKITDPS